jgi:hypothetical protein
MIAKMATTPQNRPRHRRSQPACLSLATSNYDYDFAVSHRASINKVNSRNQICGYDTVLPVTTIPKRFRHTPRHRRVVLWPNRDPLGELGFELTANRNRPKDNEKIRQQKHINELLSLIQTINPTLGILVKDRIARANPPTTSEAYEDAANLYAFIGNAPIFQVDDLGLWHWGWPPWGPPPPPAPPAPPTDIDKDPYGCWKQTNPRDIPCPKGSLGAIACLARQTGCLDCCEQKFPITGSSSVDYLNCTLSCADNYKRCTAMK